MLIIKSVKLKPISFFILLNCFLFSYLTTDFKEDQIPLIYQAPYFDDNQEGFLLNEKNLEVHVDKVKIKYSYEVLNVNNYYPQLKVDVNGVNDKILSTTKRYIIIIDKKDTKELAVLFWYRNNNAPGGGETYLFYSILSKGKSRKDLNAFLEKSKKMGNIQIHIKEKDGVVKGRYTQFLI